MTNLVPPEIAWPGPIENSNDHGSDRDNAQALLHRALLVSASLQMAAKVPCFEPGEIVRLDPNQNQRNQWSAQLAAVVPVGFSPAIAKATLGAAIKLLLTLDRLQPAPESSQKIFEQLERVIEGIAQTTPGGKSTVPVLLAAHRNKIPFLSLGSGAYQLGWGSKARILDRSSLDQDTRLGTVISENKARTAQMLHTAGLPAPKHQFVQTLEAALKAGQSLGWPVVVKPADLNRGEGVTIDVDDEEKLKLAFEQAAKLSKNILVEEQIPGVCHRILIVNDELICAIKRNPKSVQGDGELTFRELMEKETAEQLKIVPWKRRKTIIFDDETKKFTASQGYLEGTVVPKDSYVYLRKIESTEGGGTPEDLTDKIHPDNVDLAVRASRLIGLKVCGVDLMSVDITKPWYETGAKVIELNFAPLFLSKRGNYHDSFFDLLFPQSSQIQIEVIESARDSGKLAKQVQAKRKAAGERCYLILDNQVFRPDGSIYPLVGNNAKDLVRALLLDRTVDSIVVVES